MVIARYVGTCRHCKNAIIPGQLVQKTSLGWAHAGCASSEAFNRRWVQLKNEAARREDEQEKAVIYCIIFFSQTWDSGEHWWGLSVW